MTENITKNDIFWRKEIDTPSSNRNILIFPFNYRNLQFSYNFYSQIMTDNRIPKVQIDSFFEEIHAACNNFSSLRDWEDVFYITFYSFLLICTMCTIFLEKKYPLLAEIVFCLGFFVPLLVAAYNIARVKKLLLSYRNKITGIINYSNQNLYKIMGVKWVLSQENFDWIELWLEYRFEKEPNKAYFDDSHLTRRWLGGAYQPKYPPMMCDKLICCLNNLPPSCEVCAVFPMNYKTFQYTYSFYTPEMTNYRVSYQEIVDFFQGAARSTNNFEVLSKRLPWEYFLTFLQVGLVVLGIFLSVYIKHDLLNAQKILGTSMCLIVAHFIQIFKQYHRSDVMQQLVIPLETFIEQANKQFESKGVRWVLSPTDVDWIELWYDYKYSEDQVEYKPGLISKQSNDDLSTDSSDLQSLLKIDTAEHI